MTGGLVWQGELPAQALTATGFLAAEVYRDRALMQL